jgi:Raf kinase inhibitor-like YbhB/YbcL family protein
MGRFCIILFAVMAAATPGTGFTLTSTAFAPGAAVPPVHTCDGADTSPPLVWTGAPAGTKAFALICHDPDAPAGDWLHWAVWNIPAGLHGLAEGVPKKESLPDGTQQGHNDFGRPGYGGPCPPGGTHHYVFALSALDASLTLPASASRAEIEKAIQGHTLGTAELTGTYTRKKR